VNNFDLICKLQKYMLAENVDYYISDTNDPHGSEYVCGCFKIREMFSGFTGSNGILVVLKNEAYLWTDGRYFVQAEKELPSNISLMKMGEKGVPTISSFLMNKCQSGEVIGFNGKLITAAFYDELLNIVKEKNILLKTDFYVEDVFLSDRPRYNPTKAYIIDEKYSGESIKQKISRVRDDIKQNNYAAIFLTKLDDQMWLYNIRGNDIECNPVISCYSLIDAKKVHLFIREESLDKDITVYLKDADVIIHNYNEVDEFLVSYINNCEGYVFCDKRYLNSSLYEILENAHKGKYGICCTEYFKSIKNETEINNLKKAYIYDSAVVTRFIKYIKENRLNGITEVDASEKLDFMRSELADFIELSFPTISAFGPNAAMMHYEASRDNCSVIEPDGIYLVDSGGQYMLGTTDVTRSIILGNITDEMKKSYTLSAVGMLRLMNAVFIKGCTGRNLDILARGALWKYLSDYKCGTGHGIGHILNVHEGPQNIGWQKRKNGIDEEFKAGMIVSDEPGVYKADEFGIRIENILLCVEKGQSSDGDFLSFVPLTFVPLDNSGIDKSYMNSEDVEMYNNYQNMVYEIVSPLLDEQDKSWLKVETSNI